MKYTIHVTKEDIEKAKLQKVDRIHNCPVALAIKRDLNSAYASVGINYITYKHDLPQKDWDAVFSTPIYDMEPLPHEVVDFIMDFDQNKPVEPFEFTIDL